MPDASAHDLAVATFQSDQAFGTLAGRLVDRGLIERRAGRGRRLEHVLTEAGRSALDEGNAIATHVLADLFAPLAEPQRRALSDALRVLTADVGTGPGPRGEG
jgi:DNA-binding MarR family transcriptional regulator